MQWELEPDLRKLRIVARMASDGANSKLPSIENRLILSRALIHLGEFHQATSCLREAITVRPPSAELQMELAETLVLQDLFEEALRCAETALTIAAGDVRMKRRYWNVLARSRLCNNAAIGNDESAAFLSTIPRLIEMQARSLGPVDRLKLCNERLASDPAHTEAKFLKAVTLAELGLDEQARDLIGLDRLIEIRELGVQVGYADEPAFRETLEREIRTNPTLAADPRGRATRDGMVTRCLRQPDAMAVESLRAEIRQAVEAYERRLVSSGDDFALGRPRKARLVTWAVICGGAGRQRSHRHPDGWLSGVYYVAAPRSNGEGAWRGPLMLGALDPDRHPGDPPWGTRAIEPQPGRLVLFPSYVPHAFEATGLDGDRISVAFDVVPVQENALC